MRYCFGLFWRNGFLCTLHIIYIYIYMQCVDFERGIARNKSADVLKSLWSVVRIVKWF